MAKIAHYDIGDLWTPQMTWKIDANNDGVPDTPTDPSQIVLRLQTPAGVESVYTTASSPSALTSASTPLARLSAGVFKPNPGIALDSAGYWFLRAEGIGAAQASEEFQAIVDPSEFTADGGLSARALVTLSETKDWLQQQNIDTSDDLELVGLINDISDRIHYEAGREFKPVSAGESTRTFEVDTWARCVYVGDMATLSTASSPVAFYAQDWQTNTYNVAQADVTASPMTARGLAADSQAGVPAERADALAGYARGRAGHLGLPGGAGQHQASGPDRDCRRARPRRRALFDRCRQRRLHWGGRERDPRARGR